MTISYLSVVLEKKVPLPRKSKEIKRLQKVFFLWDHFFIEMTESIIQTQNLIKKKLENPWDGVTI